MKLINDNSNDKAGKGEAPRSDKWPKARKEWLQGHPACAVCDGRKKLEVHHKKPFHLHPDLELDPSNFITLCEKKEDGVNCHLLFGHLGNFRSYNENVAKDAEKFSR